MAVAVEEMVKAVPFGPEHAAYVAGLRMLALELDARADDKLWREFRMLLKDLREASTSGGGDDDGFQALVERLSQMGDTTKS